jgi:integrase
MATKRVRKFTPAACAALPPGDVLRADEMEGLQLQVSAGGVRTWVLKYRGEYRADGTRAQRSMALGRFPAVSVAEVREAWRATRAEIDAGVDPLAKRERERDEQIAQQRAAAARLTFEQAYKRYMTEYSEQQHRQPKAERSLFVNAADAEVSAGRFGDLLVTDITRRTVKELRDVFAERGRVVANRTVGAVSRLYGWLVHDREIVEPEEWPNPTTGIKKLDEGGGRTRVLTDAELAAVWLAADGLSYPYGPYAKLLILTGCRSIEIRNLRWTPDPAQRHGHYEGGTLRFPPGSTKNKRSDHTVYLSRQAIAILEACPRFIRSDFVLTRGRPQPVELSTHTKKLLDARLPGMTPWRLHDLRRTHAVGLQALGQPAEVVQRALNHSRGPISGVTSIYARHAYKDELTAAWQQWSDHVLRLAHPPVISAVA